MLTKKISALIFRITQSICSTIYNMYACSEGTHEWILVRPIDSLSVVNQFILAKNANIEKENFPHREKAWSRYF